MNTFQFKHSHTEVLHGQRTGTWGWKRSQHCLWCSVLPTLRILRLAAVSAPSVDVHRNYQQSCSISLASFPSIPSSDNSSCLFSPQETPALAQPYKAPLVSFRTTMHPRKSKPTFKHPEFALKSFLLFIWNILQDSPISMWIRDPKTELKKNKGDEINDT